MGEFPKESEDNSQGLRMDALLDALVLYTKIYHKPFSAEALTAGLPLRPGEKSPQLFSLEGAKGLFSRAASRAGLVTTLVERPLGRISPLQLPMILLLANEEVCILDSFSEDGKRVKVILPAEEANETWYDREELEKQYLGWGFMLKKAFEYSDSHSRTLQIDQKHWFWSTLKHSWPLYRDVLLASILVNLFVLATPLFTMNVYDRVIPNNAVETLQVFAIGVLTVYLLDLFLKFTRTRLLEIAAKKSDVIMSSILFEKVMDLKMAVHPRSVGSFASNLKDFDSIRSFFTNATMTALIDLPFALLFLLVIYYIGGPLALMPLLIMLLILIYAIFLRGPLQRSIESTHEASAKKNAILIESLQNIETLKTLGNVGHVQWAWEEATGEIAQKSLKTRSLSASITTTTSFFIQLNTVLIVLYGVYLIQSFELTMGGLIATIILSSRCVAPMGQAAALITNYEDARSSYNTLDEIVSQPAERPKGKKFVERPDFSGRIEFKEVTFTYPDSEVPALKEVSFSINPREKVALIGRIGSGKSTIEKLLLKLYEPDSGSILVDGIDIAQIDPADLRKSLGYVAQDITLFKGTIKENITYRASHASDDQVIRAARISGAEEFINKHPMGYGMAVGERGAGLSGGQRQCVGIARAFLTDVPIVLLDEPTSGMDQLSEAALLARLHQNLKEKTTLLITQKLNLLELTERVIVMEEGKVYLDGPKEQVLTRLSGAVHGKT